MKYLGYVLLVGSLVMAILCAWSHRLELAIGNAIFVVLNAFFLRMDGNTQGLNEARKLLEERFHL